VTSSLVVLAATEEFAKMVSAARDNIKVGEVFLATATSEQSMKRLHHLEAREIQSCLTEDVQVCNASISR
jgi:hypothetical protein